LQSFALFADDFICVPSCGFVDSEMKIDTGFGVGSAGDLSSIVDVSKCA
jgi:hypothetical protein